MPEMFACDVYLLDIFNNLVLMTSIQYVIHSYMYSNNTQFVFC